MFGDMSAGQADLLSIIEQLPVVTSDKAELDFVEEIPSP
jgi:hypothetical protein